MNEKIVRRKDKIVFQEQLSLDEIKERKHHLKELIELEETERRLKETRFNANDLRARSITVGTAFGGTSEVSMRSDGGDYVYSILQPVEVMELIHQLAANIGCHLAVKPREDFASWRNWKITDAEKEHLNGFPPFVSDMALAMNTGRALPPPSIQQADTQISVSAKKVGEKDEVMAIEEPVNKRTSKRAPKAS